MKKQISMLLVVCMILSAFVVLTSCKHTHAYQDEWSQDETHHWHACEKEGCDEVADKAEHTWNDGVLTKPGSGDEDGVMTYTCTACGYQKSESIPVVTTVSEKEWYEAFKKNNFTMNGVYCTEQNVKKRYMYQVSDKYVCVESSSNGKSLYANVGGVWCSVRGQNMYQEIQGSIHTSVKEVLEGYFDLPDYESFTYDEATKAYVYTRSDATERYYQIKLYFEYGALVKVEAYKEPDTEKRSYRYNFTEYGTTEVKIDE